MSQVQDMVCELFSIQNGKLYFPVQDATIKVNTVDDNGKVISSKVEKVWTIHCIDLEPEVVC
jgi:hypothetical protein